ncbi:MAG: site-2 protease family protein [Oscillospiraceae bacterium]|nr:site-2 protease family protein [Oscillospiraceae bacterium]
MIAALFNFTQFSMSDLTSYLIGMLALLLSLSVHECAHAWVANALGDSTGKEAGRVTLNPLAHLDPVGGLLILIGAPVAWAKPVPFNPNRFNRKYTVRKGIALVSIAGISANLIMAVAAYLAYAIFYVITVAAQPASGSAINSILSIVRLFLATLYTRNIYLAIFNLLPVPPLDGYKFFGLLMPDKIYYKIMQYERYIGMAFIVLIIFGSSYLSQLLSLLATPLEWIIRTPIDALARAVLSLL